MEAAQEAVEDLLMGEAVDSHQELRMELLLNRIKKKILKLTSTSTKQFLREALPGLMSRRSANKLSSMNLLLCVFHLASSNRQESS